jgi:hypothetical protein
MLATQAAAGRFIGGWFSLRFVGRSRAILSPQRSDMTCMMEITGLRTLSSTKTLQLMLETLARSFGGITHWAMSADTRYEDVARGYPRLDTWLRVRQQLTNGGTVATFDSPFTDRCGLSNAGVAPGAAPKVLLRRTGDGAIFVVYGGAKFHVPDPATLARLYPAATITDAQDGEVEHIADVPGDGTLLHEESTGKVFVIMGGAKFHVPDPTTLARVFPGFLLRPLWAGALDAIPDVPVDATLLREESGPISVILGGALFTLPDPKLELPAPSAAAPAIVNSMLGRYVSMRGPVRRLWDGALGSIGLIPVDGSTFREESSDVLYMIAGGRKDVWTPPPGRGPHRPPKRVYVVWDGALDQIPSVPLVRVSRPVGELHLAPPIVGGPRRPG